MKATDRPPMTVVAAVGVQSVIEAMIEAEAEAEAEAAATEGIDHRTMEVYPAEK